MHSHKIIHRDIKLENIMISSHRQKDLTAKLADFGLAETFSKTAAARIDSRKSGTAGYTAPEILAGRPYGTASDMWSLGCLIYAMLTVALPFPAEDMDSADASPGKRRFHSRVDYSMLDLDFEGASIECKDLLSKLLLEEPSLRLTVEQVLEHPFLAE